MNRFTSGPRFARDDVLMDVQLLVVPNCSNEQEARVVLRRALADARVGDLPIRTLVVSTAEQAQDLSFTGSPTVLLDGADPFPTPDLPRALACRMYPQPGGGPRGVPEVQALVAAIRRAAEHSSTEADPPELDSRASAAAQAAIDIAAGR